MKLLFPMVFMALGAPAMAESHYIAPISDPVTLEECSACHMAFPARLLPGASWNAILDTLDDHFGEDASLAPDVADEIRAYLSDEAPRKVRGVDNDKPVLRITELGWFTHEHGSRAKARAENDPKIGTLSNCAGCHRDAEKGYFDE